MNIFYLKPLINIIQGNKDRDNLIDRLSDLLPATQTACYAWAFIPNHAHFSFQVTQSITAEPRSTDPYAAWCESGAL
jgi:hypothetical protein